MAPMIFISSALSHLFGASVGREGVAVQMGASLSDQFSRYFGRSFENRKIILMIGMSAGFSSMFGAPLAGAVFGMEILFSETIPFKAFLPCLVAAYVGRYTAVLLGIPHEQYGVISSPNISFLNILLVTLAAVCFGLVARFFIWLLHFLKDLMSKSCPNPIHRPLVGGILTIVLIYFFKTDRYQSLGEEIVTASFNQHIYPWDFLGKIFMTALSLGSGFKGGEVMPLFFIGATLGNALSLIMPLALSLMTALGFVSVFAGASNAPLTSFLLAISFFGTGISFYAGIAVFVSYLVSGHKAIYHTHRKHRLKKF
jgi:H+/Cl- antiporter ClcA